MSLKSLKAGFDAWLHNNKTYFETIVPFVFTLVGIAVVIYQNKIVSQQNTLVEAQNKLVNSQLQVAQRDADRSTTSSPCQSPSSRASIERCSVCSHVERNKHSPFSQRTTASDFSKTLLAFSNTDAKCSPVTEYHRSAVFC